MAASTDAGASTPLPASSGALAASSLAAYSGFALPLTMLALPVYVLVPPFYADATGLALSTIGAILLATRLLDAFVDPLLGGWIDRARGTYLRPLLLAVPVMAGGFVVLFAPPSDLTPLAAGAWLALALTCTTLGYSLATIAYQAWGARLADHDAGRARVTAWREAFGLAGVILASLLSTKGAPTLIALFLGTLALALAALVARAPRTPPALAMGPASPWRALSSVFAQTRFRWLLAIFVANGVAAAVPATLVLFFVADRLQLSTQSGVLLALYFVAAACSMPLWASLARRVGLHASWLVGMALAVAVFVWAYGLGAGDFTAFAAICVLSGCALGADLVLPPALLARVIALNGDAGAREGTYFGLWNFANKMNLALAAGLALPALQALGYTPGDRDPAALQALAFAYAVLPCILKLVAAALLLFVWRGKRC